MKKNIASEKPHPKFLIRQTETVTNAKINVYTAYDSIDLLRLFVLKRNFNEMGLCSVQTPAVRT